jgi:hypothetical protein
MTVEEALGVYENVRQTVTMSGRDHDRMREATGVLVGALAERDAALGENEKRIKELSEELAQAKAAQAAAKEERKDATNQGQQGGDANA